MNSKKMEHVRKQLRRNTPDAIVELIATQMERSQDAQKRISEEGIVVRDMKGSVIPHPAIKIELESGKRIAELVHKHQNF